MRRKFFRADYRCYLEHGHDSNVRLEKKKLDPTENGKSVVPMVSLS